MKWQASDMQTFMSDKQYIDTVIIPLVPVEWSETMVNTVREGGYIQTMAMAIEKELKGRIVESPPFTYLKQESLEERMKRIQMWKDEIKSSGVKYVIFMTSDVDWKQKESELGELLWMPAVPLEHMDSRHRADFLEENMGSILKTITDHWTQGTQQ
ncbi:DUF2487 family protein [Tuberibacillus sp. Marseille-P3662]|uniref:DUF2487 family protein n=1 Tax=Tuberibacillus sp. Marseille-P3662 TaxID=1965358 RepID=UPI000A1CEEE3|nr:DUF2487 family protein [Tuberibacillus sp. Marseille-P3662]